MKQIRIGIPRALHYYYFIDFWIPFFEELKIEVVVSPPTTKQIMEEGIKCSFDEMCTSLKTYLGHVAYLQDKCDYLLLPRIDNYGQREQTCTNFLALLDITRTLFQTPILSYNIDYVHHQTEGKGLLKLHRVLGRSKKKIKRAYEIAKIKEEKAQKKRRIFNENKLHSTSLKILIVAHPYNIYDEYMGTSLVQYLEKLGCTVIYANEFDPSVTIPLSKEISESLYWRYSKEQLGAISLVKNEIDGILFFSSFPCGLDSLVNELAFRKVSIPHLNIIMDDLDSLTGMETRLESFVDILQARR